jgi:hypothetical protein
VRSLRTWPVSSLAATVPKADTSSSLGAVAISPGSSASAAPGPPGPPGPPTLAQAVCWPVAIAGSPSMATSVTRLSGPMRSLARLMVLARCDVVSPWTSRMR